MCCISCQSPRVGRRREIGIYDVTRCGAVLVLFGSAAGWYNCASRYASVKHGSHCLLKWVSVGSCIFEKKKQATTVIVATARITTAEQHRPFRRICRVTTRQCAPLSNTWLLRPTQIFIPSASRSIHPFSTARQHAQHTRRETDRPRYVNVCSNSPHCLVAE